MSKFWMVTEDPDYDEDGQLPADPGDLVYSEELGEWVEAESFDPFETVNS